MIRFRSPSLTGPLMMGLVAAALLTGSVAQAAAPDDQSRRTYEDRRDRGDDRTQSPRSDRRSEPEARRAISESEALSRAQRQARGARFVGSQGRQGSSYVFLFERDGRTFTVSVSAYD